MKILYADKKLEKSVASLGAIAKNYGTRAKLVNLRLEDIKAASNLGTMRLLGGNCHELAGNLKGKLSVTISHNHRIVFEPANDPIPRKGDGGLDWYNVTSIRITEIGEDYHGR
jgi:proteic killer suppression protein